MPVELPVLSPNAKYAFSYSNSIHDEYINKILDANKGVSLTNCNNMFTNYTSFNHSMEFDTTKVTDMQFMFRDCYEFNQPVEYDTTNVTNMSNMFRDCKTFNQPVGFNTSNVTNMSSMFSRCNVFNQSVSNFNTSNVTDMSSMFGHCNVFNQELSNFDTSKVTNMSEMFGNCLIFNQPVEFDTSNVISMSYMLGGCDVYSSKECFIKFHGYAQYNLNGVVTKIQSKTNKTKSSNLLSWTRVWCIMPQIDIDPNIYINSFILRFMISAVDSDEVFTTYESNVDFLYSKNFKVEICDSIDDLPSKYME